LHELRSGTVFTEEHQRPDHLRIDRAKHSPERQFSPAWFRTVVQIKHLMAMRNQS
jgi:hypothetical protein